MKTCAKCHLPFPSAAYSKDASKADGLQCWCKACRRNRYAENRSSEIKYASDYVAANAETAYPKKRLYNKLYRKKPTPEARRMSRMAAIRRNPEKHAARRALRRAVRLGRIIKPELCSVCFTSLPSAKIHGHHEDYGKPLEVVWLCAACHGKQHRIHAVEAEVQA